MNKAIRKDHNILNRTFKQKITDKYDNLVLKALANTTPVITGAEFTCKLTGQKMRNSLNVKKEMNFIRDHLNILDIFEKYSSESLILCHNDLQENNILKVVGRDALHIVDIETLAMNLWTFDITTLIIEEHIN